MNRPQRTAGMRILCCLVVVAQGQFLNLEGLRAARSTRPLANRSTHALYNRFRDPLPSTLIAPSCGNGQLDNGAVTNSEQWAAGIIIATEICDDGNRLDGDGCAADCLSMDALTSPCPLAIDTGGEEIVTMGFNAYLFAVFTPTRMIRMRNIDLKVLSVDKYSIGPVVTAWQQQLEFFVYGGGRVWMPFNSQAGIAGLAIPSPTPYEPLPVLDSPVGIVRASANNGRYLVTAAGEIVDVPGRRVTNWTQTPTAASELWNAEIILESQDALTFACTFKNKSQIHFVLDEVSHKVLPYVTQTAAPTDAEMLDPSSPGYPWLYLFSKALQRDMRPVTSDVSGYGAYRWNKGSRIGFSSFMVGPLSITYPKLSARDVLTGVSQMGALGDPLFTSGRVETALCNGTNASCLLDVPLCYDVLAPNAYASTGGSTLFTALDAASRTSKTWEETVAKADLKCGKGEVVQQILIHPDTKALWIRRGSQIYEVGRRGTQVRAPSSLTGQCVPSMSGACMPGNWSWSGLACKPCASFDMAGGDGAYPNLVAHAQQCANADTSLPQGAGRRLLQDSVGGEGVEMIVVSNVLTNSSAATALFAPWGSTLCEGTTTGGAWKYAYACKLSRYVKADPFQVLRALKATAQPNITDFLSPATRVVPYADPTQVQGLSMDLLVGLIVGGGIVLVLLVMGCVWGYMHCCHGSPRGAAYHMLHR
jgi:cysteine-rich repeat protein